MKHLNINVLSGSNATNQTGPKIDAVELALGASFHILIPDTTAVGTLIIQGSNDICGTQYLPATFTPTHWNSIPNATATITAGGSSFILLPQVSFRWMRAVWTQTTPGTSTINVNMFALSY